PRPDSSPQPSPRDRGPPSGRTLARSLGATAPARPSIPPRAPSPSRTTTTSNRQIRLASAPSADASASAEKIRPAQSKGPQQCRAPPQAAATRPVVPQSSPPRPPLMRDRTQSAPANARRSSASAPAFQALPQTAIPSRDSGHGKRQATALTKSLTR